MKHLSILRIAAIVAALLLPAVMLAKDPAEKPGKVNVCHVTGNGTYVPISISKNAQPAHEAHGDALPGALVGNPVKFLGDNCSLKDVQRVSTAQSTSQLVLGPLGWGGMSCPAGTTVVGGGYEPTSLHVTSSYAAVPGAPLYPEFPHYKFVPVETGWVIQNINQSQTFTEIYALCVVE